MALWQRRHQNKWVDATARASLRQVFVDRGSKALSLEEATELARQFVHRQSPHSAQIYQLFRNWAQKAQRLAQFDVHAQPITVCSIYASSLNFWLGNENLNKLMFCNVFWFIF